MRARAGTAASSPALNWRTGLDLGAAREKVSVTRALRDLPRLSAAIQRGRLAYSKVRALTRMTTAETEAALLDFAHSATGAQVEQFVRAWRRVDRVAEARDDARRHARRHLESWVDDDGMVVIRGRLSAEVGAVVRRALEAAAEQLYEEASEDERLETTGSQRRADRLGLVAESALSAELDRGTGGDRSQVVVNVESETLAGETPAADASVAGSTGQTALEEPEGLHVSAETSRRLACDASMVTMRHTPDGAAADVGRKTRVVPPAVRRTLTAVRCDAHHVQHWADGGTTKVDNLVLLCRRHHRAVHQEGFGGLLHPARRTGDAQLAGCTDLKRGAAGSDAGAAQRNRYQNRCTHGDATLVWRAIRRWLGNRPAVEAVGRQLIGAAVIISSCCLSRSCRCSSAG